MKRTISGVGTGGGGSASVPQKFLICQKFGQRIFGIFYNIYEIMYLLLSV